ncbi:hypothetical protein [Trinickia mobilis]|uniref:hypothetical protein n=1 Tax=Trinickia mobilis TaxID=2816356 RepID=UPI001A9040CC|nr:hypothetical protein [Trinickia mobilis]
MEIDVGTTSKRYDHEDAYYAVIVDDLLGAPDALIELRRATNELILLHARRAGQQVVKVVAGDLPPRKTVKGYVTFLECIVNSRLQELEQKLGFKSGALQRYGAYLYNADALSLNVENIAPRGNTDWSGGVTPRDLFTLSEKMGADVGYHRDYPRAIHPIFQFEILKDVPIIGAPRFIVPNGVV